MVMGLQLPISTSLPSSSSSPALLGPRNLRNLRTFCSVNGRATAKAKIPVPPTNPKDPFLSKLASVAATSPETLLNRPVNSETPPFLDLFESPKLMATPAQVFITYIHTYIFFFIIICVILVSLYVWFGFSMFYDW